MIDGMHGEARAQGVIDLLSNVMEAFSAVLFVPAEKNDALKIHCFHTLSKNMNPGCEILPGEGMVGWVYREQKPMTVNNFERSTTTLKFYDTDEEIKSFMAVPFPDRGGVLSVDSKKSYLYTDAKEKIFRQFADIIWAAYLDEKDMERRRIFNEILDLSQEIDGILNSYLTTDELLYYCIEKIFNYINAKLILFVLPDHEIKYFFFEKNKNVIKTNDVDLYIFSKESLIGWVVSNQKRLVLENIIDKDGKSYLLNKNEKTGKFSNFIGIPLIVNDCNLFGAVGLICDKNKKWYPNELDIIEKIIQRVYRVYCYSK